MELYRRHASTIFCIDFTHGTNEYRLKLVTCVAPDDHGKGRSMIQIPYSESVTYFMLITHTGYPLHRVYQIMNLVKSLKHF